MNNERKPSGNQNNMAGRRPSPAPHQGAKRPPTPNVSGQIPFNATQRNTPNATQKKAPRDFVAKGGNSSPHPPIKHPNATQNIPMNATQKRPVPTAPQKPFPVKKKAEEIQPPKRRRNDESYVFSRSLSETHERILEERRERLEDAKKFRMEDVRQKIRIGAISFIASVLLISVILSLAISCALKTDKVTKNKGEYVYNIGKTSQSVA